LATVPDPFHRFTSLQTDQRLSAVIVFILRFIGLAWTCPSVHRRCNTDSQTLCWPARPRQHETMDQTWSIDADVSCPTRRYRRYLSRDPLILPTARPTLQTSDS
jgi:hypothetical protein